VLFVGVVPEHEVQKILHRRVLEQFLMRQKHLILQFSYKSLRNNVSNYCCVAYYMNVKWRQEHGLRGDSQLIGWLRFPH
jgi:hypothetical protein